MEKVRQWLRKWLGIEHLEMKCNNANTANADNWLIQVDLVNELQGKVADLEAAYPDYKKAKAEADERKGKEIVPGFRPFSQRKREWEASRRKQPEKK